MLLEMRLRKVAALAEKGADAEGFLKVVEVEGYPGMFRDADNKVHDLRPRDSRPCKANLLKRTQLQLAELLKKAYEEQLKQMKEQKNTEKHYQNVFTDLEQRQRRLCQTFGLSDK